MSSIEVGGKVLVTNSQSTRITTIERETKTQWVTKEGGKYRKDDLYSVGTAGDWNRFRLVPLTEEGEEEFRNKVKQQIANRKLCSNDFLNDLTDMPLEFKIQLIETVNQNKTEVTKC